MSSRFQRRGQIKQAIIDCRDTNRTCTREVLSEMTGLTLTMVDDHLKRLKADEEIRRVANGVFEPVEASVPDREVGATIVPGRGEQRPVRFQVGSTVLEMTLREARNAAGVLGGIGLQFRG